MNRAPSPPSLAEPDLQAILAEAERLGRLRPVLGRIHLVLPLLVLGVIVCLLLVSGDLGRVSAAAATSFVTVGKLIILLGAVPKNPFGMNAIELGVMVFAMDTLYGYFLAFNLHHLHRVRRLGPALLRLQNYGRWWLTQQRWMRRWAFTGVMLFVLFPLTGTGAPGGAVLGRLVGLSASVTLFAITLGSFLGCFLMAAFAEPLEPIFHDLQKEWWFQGIGILILAIVVLVLVLLGRRLSRAAEAHAAAQGAKGEA